MAETGTSKGNEVRLLVAVPTMGSVHPILVSRLIKWGRDYPDSIHFYFSFKVAPVDRARNQIVEQFLSLKVGKEQLPLTHLLFIDSDTIPPVDAVERLLSHGKDVVSGLTPIINHNQPKNAWETFDNCFQSRDTDAEGKFVKTNIARRHTGLQEIFRCGASCLLLRREVFEALTPPYFQFITNAENTSHVRSEDINFCDKVKEAGMSIYADTEVVCEHYKEIQL